MIEELISQPGREIMRDTSGKFDVYIDQTGIEGGKENQHRDRKDNHSIDGMMARNQDWIMISW